MVINVNSYTRVDGTNVRAHIREGGEASGGSDPRGRLKPGTLDPKGGLTAQAAQDIIRCQIEGDPEPFVTVTGCTAEEFRSLWDKRYAKEQEEKAGPAAPAPEKPKKKDPTTEIRERLKNVLPRLESGDGFTEEDGLKINAVLAHYPGEVACPVPSGRLRADMVPGREGFRTLRGGFDSNRDRNGANVEGDHHGIDLEANPGDSVISPVKGKIIEINYDLYGDTSQYPLVTILDENGRSHDLFYVAPAMKKGDTVEHGQQIGTLKDISKKSGYGNTPTHLHYEIRQSVSKKEIPEGPFKPTYKVKGSNKSGREAEEEVIEKKGKVRDRQLNPLNLLKGNVRFPEKMTTRNLPATNVPKGRYVI